jgi:hypothetical protein
METQINIKYSKFNSLNIFCPEIVRSGYPAKDMNMNLNEKYKKDILIPGFGIYAISYKHQDGRDLIVYLGSFKGKKEDAKGGDVRSRWFKHIATATLLHKNLRWKSDKLIFDEIERINNYCKNDLNFMKTSKNSLIQLSKQDLEKNVIKADGLQLSKNRMRFAMQNFSDFHKDEPNSQKELNNIISKFNCHYWQILIDKPLKKPDIEEKMHNTEKEIISEYKTKLPMNGEYKVNSFNGSYHYDLKKLIDTQKTHFETFSLFIINKIKNKFF